MTNADIIKKLVGPVSPVADAAIDPDRLHNLKELCELVNGLVAEISGVAVWKNSDYSSAKQVGQYAETYLKVLKETLHETGK